MTLSGPSGESSGFENRQLVEAPDLRDERGNGTQVASMICGETIGVANLVSLTNVAAGLIRVP